jgi:hypothetical protein
MTYFKAGPLSRHLLDGMRKTTKTLSQDSRSSGRDLNPGPPVYEAGVLTTRTRRKVFRIERIKVAHDGICA